jgi:hypothetical protein
MTTLPDIIGALITDTFQLTGLRGGSVAGLAIGRYFRRRAEQARDILFKELRHANIGDAQAASEDDKIAVITGEPTPIQHIETQKIHPRTFHIDPSGRMLVA